MTLFVLLVLGNNHGTAAALEYGKHLVASGEPCEYLLLHGLPAVDVQEFPAGSRVAERLIAARHAQLRPWFEEIGQLHCVRVDASDAAWAGAMPTDIEALRQARPGGWDLGEAVLSSVISHVREPRPDLKRLAREAQGFWTGGAAVYTKVTEFLKAREDIRRVIVFNGRHAVMRPVIRSAERLGREVQTTEAGLSQNTYAVYRGMRHDPANVLQDINACWDNSELDEAERKARAQAYFDSRRPGSSGGAANRFARHHRSEDLPDGWDPEGTNIVVFDSSYDEFCALGSVWNLPEGLRDQEDAIARLVDEVGRRDPQAKVWVRVHPNLRGVDNSQTAALRDLERQGVRLLWGRSGVDSYALARAATSILTFGSTMGVEATVMGCHSVLLGPGYCRGLNAVDEVGGIEEAASRLLEGSFDPDRLLGALKYGFYLSKMGTPFKDWKFEGFADASYRGVPVVGNRLLHQIMKARWGARLWWQRKLWRP